MSTQASEYNEHEQAVLDLQTSLLDRGVDEIEQEIADVDDVRERSAAFLRDRGSLFRFLKKAHYNEQAAYENIKDHLSIRLQSNLDRLDLPSLLSLDLGDGELNGETPPPVAYFMKNVTDIRGRLVLVVTLSRVIPRHTLLDGVDDKEDEDSFDEIKESILYIWEVGRRLMQMSTARTNEPCLDFLTVVDASNASMSNIHYDVVKFFADIISTHFPNTSKQIIIVNSKLWTNTLWRMAKPLLPKKIVDRISFVGRNRVGVLFDPSTLPTYLGGEKTYDKISDYVTTTAPAEAHSTVLTRNSSRSTTWYTPKQTPAITPDSSYTHIPAVVNKIPIFQLKMKRGVGGSNSDSYSHMPSQAKVDDILSYKEQISAWHKDRISNSVESESIATPLQSSGVGTPITTLDRYSYLNPRYGYKTIYKISRRNGKLIVQSKPRMRDLVITLLHLALKRYAKRIKVVLMLAGVLLRHKFGLMDG